MPAQHRRQRLSPVRRGEQAAAAAAYDFRRPIQLSREHLRTLQVAFDTFARQATTLFTSSLRHVSAMTLTSIEQRSYAEYVAMLDSETYMTIFSAEPMHGRCVMEIPLPAVMSSIDHMLGGPGTGNQPKRPLSDIESEIFGAFAQRLLGELRYALEGTLDVDPVIAAREYSPQFVQAAAATDVMVVVILDLEIGPKNHRVTMCMPFAGLLPLLEQAAAPGPVSDRERIERMRSAELLGESFEDVPVEVAIRFRATRVAPATLAGLNVGDVITLDHPAAAPLDVRVGGTSFAHATPGARGPRLAALIVSPSKEI